MKNLINILFFTILSMSFLQAQEKTLKEQAQNSIKINNYDLDLRLQDSIIDIKLTIVAENFKEENLSYFLLNDYIKFSHAALNGKKLNYVQKNDTMFFSTQETILKFDFHYKIAYPLKKDSLSTIILCDTNQLILERSCRWYPVLYDNFAHYKATVSIPNTYIAFAYVPADNVQLNKHTNIYSFKLYDEDIPLLITKSNIFQRKNAQYNNVDFNFYILPQAKRLIDVVNGKPVYTTDPHQIDSLWNAIVNRSVEAFKWYNTNLWELKTHNINFVETSIFGIAMGMGNVIIMDRGLINMETIGNTLLAHEICHLWLGIHTLYNAKGRCFMGESIPEYVNLMFYESWAGQDAFEKALQENPEWNFPDLRITFEQLLNQRHNTGEPWAAFVIYVKGPAFVHEFRKLIGKEKLLKIIRETYSVPNQFITLEDFEEKIKENGCWNEYLKLYDIKL